MPDSPHSLTELLNAVEQLLVQGEPDVALGTCWFSIGFGGDNGHLILQVFPMTEQAHSTFQIDGNQFIAPKLHSGGHFKRASDGTITDWVWTPPPPPDPPILSNESLPDLGDENFVWRGYGQNTRGVIKMRVGRFLAHLNTPTFEDAERIARRVAELLRGEPRRERKRGWRRIFGNVRWGL